ncbi:GDSL-type esterase/lipase family protein [uncultured Draconibacterium sp.]|uniref:GDSL-type esterase/lipase family protein n=1 Tax=uncultured Draconibacterium sp. TaxID=1573823 RepID=UPI002AA82A39|nr:GDSL-type esterase/lipase family protein [uncultured Draconibacterium sp.]
MKRTILLFTLCLTILIGHTQINNKRYDVLPKREEGTSILFVGNSITDDCEWGELFENPNVLSRGIDGNITTTILDRIHELTRHKAAKVFFAIGTNDLGRTPVDTIMQNMSKIVQIFTEESPNTKIYFQSVLPVAQESIWGPGSKNDLVNELNERYKQFCKDKDITYIDLNSHFLAEDGYHLKPEFTNDGLHIMAAGYKAWKSLVIDYVNE